MNSRYALFQILSSAGKISTSYRENSLETDFAFLFSFEVEQDESIANVEHGRSSIKISVF